LWIADLFVVQFSVAIGRQALAAATKRAMAALVTNVQDAHPPDGQTFVTPREVPPMSYAAISFARKFELFAEQWQPKVIAEMNDYQFKIVRLEGDFIWHSHADTDETFIVLEGTLRIDFRDGAVDLKAGEMVIVPKGREHKPHAEREVKLLLIEPRGVANTGDEAAGARTEPNDVWI
jgi:mannose-6-phosphate isomerase-like protein (cupin superfamily)